MTSTGVIPTPFPSSASVTDSVPIKSPETLGTPALPLTETQENSKPTKSSRPATKEKENATSKSRLATTQAKTTGTATKPMTAKPLFKHVPTGQRVIKPATSTSALLGKPSPTVPRKSTPALSSAKSALNSTAQPVASSKGMVKRPSTPSKTDATKETTASRSNATKASSNNSTATNPPVAKARVASARAQTSMTEPKPSPSKSLPKKPSLNTSLTKSTIALLSSADRKAVCGPPKSQLAELKAKVEASEKELSEKDKLLAHKEAELKDLKAQITATKSDVTTVENLQVQIADHPHEEAPRPSETGEEVDIGKLQTDEVAALRDEIIRQKEEHARRAQDSELKLAQKDADQTAAIGRALGDIENENATLRADKVNLEDTIKSLNTRIAELVKKHDCEMRELSAEHESALGKASEKIVNESRTTCSRLEEKMQLARRESIEQREAAMQKERTVERAEMEQLRLTFEKAAREDAEKVEAMKKEAETLKSDLELLKIAYNEQKVQLEVMTTQLASAAKVDDNSKANAEIAIIKKEVTKLQSVQWEMEAAKEAALSALAEQHHNVMINEQQRLQEVSVEVEKYAAEQDESKKVIEELKREIDMLKVALEDQKQEHEEERKQLQEKKETINESLLEAKLAESVAAAREEARDAGRNEATAVLEEQIMAMKEVQEAKEIALLDAQAKIEQLEEELSAARSAAVQPDQKEDVSGEEHNACDFADFKTYKEEMDTLCQRLKETLEQKVEEVNTLTKKVEYVTKAHVEDVESIRNRSAQELGAMQEMLKAKEKDYNDNINNLKAENAQFVKMIHQLQQDLHDKETF